MIKIFFILQSYLIVLSILVKFSNMLFSILVSLFIIGEIIGVLIFARKFSSFLNLFSISTISYNTFFILPYFLNSIIPLEEISYLSFLISIEYLNTAVLYYITFKVAFNLSFILPLSFNSSHSHLKVSNLLNFSRIQTPKLSNFIIFVIITLISLIQIFLGVGFENFISSLLQGERFLLSNPTISNLSYILLFLLFAYTYFFYAQKRVNLFLLFYSFITAILYPFANSSRSMAIPFLIMFFIDYIIRKKRYLALSKLLSAFLVYFFALSFRGRGEGFFNIFDFLVNLKDILYGVIYATSNIPTLTKTIEGINTGIINIEMFPFPFSLLFYILYLSPLPAFLHGEKILYLNSLTPHFDFPLGITLDIVSESLLWFGYYGLFIFGFFWGYVIGYINNYYFKEKNLISFICFITSSYFLIATNTYPTRHSSRFLIYSLSIIFIFKLLKSFRKHYSTYANS